MVKAAATSKPVSSTRGATGATGAAAGTKTAAKKTAAAKTSAAQRAAAALPELPERFDIGSIRATRGLGEVLSEGGISSAFPVDDLSRIETHGRYAAGFRLDG